MAEIATSVLIGSFELASNATVTIAGTDRTIPAGDWYLWDDGSAYCLLTKLQTEIAAVRPGSTVKLCKDRKVRITFNGVSTTLVIPDAIADELGFTSSPYAGATSRTAEAISRLLWVPSWPETTQGHPIGSAGRKVYDRVATSSPTGLTYDVTTHHHQTLAGWRWSAVPQARAWTPAEAPGEFVRFFNEVIVPGHRFKLYTGDEATADEASTAELVLPDALGPYWVPDPPFDWYERFVSVSDSLGANIEFEASLTAEFTS